MAYIFSGSDGIYNGSSINIKPIDNANLALMFKSTLKSAGWLLMGAGDGTTLLNTSNVFGVPASDPLTLALTGTTAGTARTGSVANGYSWFVLQQIASGGSFCFQNLQSGIGLASLTSQTWRIKYSSQGFDMTTATTSRTPQPLETNGVFDELIIAGSGRDNSPTGSVFWTQSGLIYHNLVANNAAPYDWFFAGIKSGSARTETAMLYDAMTSTGPGEVDPYIVYMICLNGQNLDAWEYVWDTTANLAAQCFIGPLNRSLRGLGRCTAMRYSTSETSESTIPAGLGTNPFTNEENIFPMVWAASGRGRIANPFGGTVTAPAQLPMNLVGYKGVGTIAMWIGSSKSYGDVITGSSVTHSPRMVLGARNISNLWCNMTMPWTGTLVNI